MATIDKQIKKVAGNIANAAGEITPRYFDLEKALRTVMRTPGVRVNRKQYLTKELKKYVPQNVVNEAVRHNPAYAGIGREQINKIAKQAIDNETMKVTGTSFAAGLPGGYAMMATVPADITQYFIFILRVMQKLAYLYGFEEFKLEQDEIDDNTMNYIMIFLGVMFGVQGANAAVKKVAEAAAKKVSRTLARKALTKGAIYPIVKQIAKAVGIKMTKEIFAKGVSKVVPVVGGVVTGGLTFFTFKPCALKLQKSFKRLNLSDPEFYQEERNGDVIDAEEYTIANDEVET